MMKSTKSKIILTAVITLVVVMLAVVVVYLSTKKNDAPPSPSPTPQASVISTPEPVQVYEVGVGEACSLSFSVSDNPQVPVCNEVCNDTDLLCSGNYECIEGTCQNPECTNDDDCVCPSSEPSPSPSDVPTAELDCVVKRVYEDEANNTSGVYYLNNEVVDTNTLSNGEVVVYNVVAANHGSASIESVQIIDTLSSNLTYMDASDGCSYDSITRVVTCEVGTLPGDTETSKSIRVQVSVAGNDSINNTAEVVGDNGQQDSCSITVSATGEIEQPPSPTPTSLPEAGIMEVTTSTLSVGILLLVVGTLGLLLI